MEGLNRTRYLVAGVAAIAIAVLVVSPALGGPSLRQLVKKEVAKQLAGKTGPQGPQGAPGGTGGQGPPGPTASGTNSANPEPDTADIGTSFTSLVSVTVTTTGTMRLIGDASLTFGGTTTPDVECRITVDGTQ